MTFSERHRLPSRASPHASSRRRARVSVRLDILHCLPIRCIPHTTTHPSAPPAALDDAFDMAQTVYHGIGARERATQRPRIAIRAPPRRASTDARTRAIGKPKNQTIMNSSPRRAGDDDDRRDARDGNARSYSFAASTDRARFFSRHAARHVYFNKEAFAGLALGLLGGLSLIHI